MRGKNIYSCEKSTPKMLPSNVEHSYSVYVLEASTSNRLTYYFPPLVSDAFSCSAAVQLKRRGAVGPAPYHQRVPFLRLHETISPSMALVDRYPFGPWRAILAEELIVAVGHVRNLCWLHLAQRWIGHLFSVRYRKSRLTRDAESHPAIPPALPALCPRRAVEKNAHRAVEDDARALGGGHLVFREPQRLFQQTPQSSQVWHVVVWSTDIIAVPQDILRQTFEDLSPDISARCAKSSHVGRCSARQKICDTYSASPCRRSLDRSSRGP